MSDLNNEDQMDIPELDDELPKMTELDMLKQRARVMGITFSNNIGLDALKSRIEEKLNGEAVKEATDTAEIQKQEELPLEAAPEVNALSPTPIKPKKPQTLRQKLYAENMRLVRLRITCLDPKKKDLPGEIFTVANEYLGTVRKFIPYGEQTDNGFHVPYVLYKQLMRRKFLSIKVKKVNGREHIEQQWVREFALDVLPTLTATELAQLGTAQLAAAGN